MVRAAIEKAVRRARQPSKHDIILMV